MEIIKKLKRRDFLIIVGLTIGVPLFRSFLKYFYYQKIRSEIEILEKIRSKLLYENFQYCSDDSYILKNYFDFSWIKYNFNFEHSTSSLKINIIDKKLSKELYIIEALRDLGFLLNLNIKSKHIINSEPLNYILNKTKHYKIEINLLITEHPQLIQKPSELIKNKKGDCEDYALLFACGLLSKNKNAFIVNITNHSICAVGQEYPKNLDDFLQKFFDGNIILIGSSEYVVYRNLPTIEILNDIREDFSISKISSIITPEKIINVKHIDIAKFLSFYKNELLKQKELIIKAVQFLNQQKITIDIDKEKIFSEYFNSWIEFKYNIQKQYIQQNKNKLFRSLAESRKKFYDILNDKKEIEIVKEYFKLQNFK